MTDYRAALTALRDGGIAFIVVGGPKDLDATAELEAMLAAQRRG